jgi:hypothetical protein
MVELRFSFVPCGEHIKWECDIIEKLDIKEEGWFVPLECYYSASPLTPQITKTLINGNITEYTVKSTYAYINLGKAIKDTKDFTANIKTFVAKWKEFYKHESYETMI